MRLSQFLMSIKGDFYTSCMVSTMKLHTVVYRSYSQRTELPASAREIE